MKKISWTTEKRKLGELVRWEPNPRQLTADQAKRLQESISEFGYSQLYEIEPDNTILDGHQRDEIMLRMSEFGPDTEIEVRVSSRKLTLDERKKYIAMKHKGAVGEWNNDLMLNLYERDELEGWGFDPVDLLKIGFEFDSGIEHDELWQGMPEFEHEDKTSYQSIHIHFKDEQEVQEFSNLIGQSLTDKTRSIWFSEREQMDNGNELYAS